MIKFAVEKRFSKEIAFTAEIDCDESAPKSWKLRLAVLWAIKEKANLSWANLSEANLSEANLSWANLSEANLSEANLSWANLSKADLSKADLSKANLSWANLSEANLSWANLSEADLSEVKKDFFARLLLAKNEVPGLYDYLMKGRVDGSCYEGECACFCGTVAKVCGENYRELSSGLKPDQTSATERWFLGIKSGDTPSNNQVSAITAAWLREFMKEHNIKFPQYKLVSSDEWPDGFKEVVRKRGTDA